MFEPSNKALQEWHQACESKLSKSELVQLAKVKGELDQKAEFDYAVPVDFQYAMQDSLKGSVLEDVNCTLFFVMLYDKSSCFGRIKPLLKIGQEMLDNFNRLEVECI